MSASSVAQIASPGLAAGPFRTNWIISWRDDLLWFIGPAAVGFLALGLMAAGCPITPLYLIALIGVDGPHVIATVTRTYLDKQERARLGWLLWIIVPFALIGPVMVSFGLGSLFYLAAYCWQHYHIAKQHFGFMMLWKAKNKERGAADQVLDRWFLLASTVLPLALFVLNTRLPNWRFTAPVDFCVIGLYAALVAVYIGRQVQKFRSGLALNAPKLLLLFALVPLQWTAFLYASRFGPDGILRAGIALGLFHALQYHRLLWFHNRNRYQAPGASAKHGAASYFARELSYYLLVAISLNFFLNVLPVALSSEKEWVKAAVWAFAFTHYVLDSRIWRLRGDKELAAALRMS